ncbi:MAG TPA: O-antigen ligase family protein [Candidatus Limnocylindria bacterium]|nr:O-antigen ligase family protein [Candidatus Limnocylindria bacterium]
MTTILDPVVAVRMLPGGLADGPIGISEPLLATAGLVALLRVRRTGWITVGKDPTFGLAVLFVGVAILSALVNRTPPSVTVLGIVMTVDAMAVYFVWRLLEPSPEAAVRAIAALVGAGVVVALFGIGQAVLAPSLLGFERFAIIPGDLGRITSILGNPNLLAPVLAFLLPFPIFAATRLPGRRVRLVAAGVALILLVGLILTFSRGAWIAAAVGITFGAVVLDWRSAVTAAAISALAIVFVLALPRHILGTDVDVAARASPTQYPSAGVASPSPGNGAQPPPTPAPTPDPLRGRTGDEIRLMFLRDGLRIVAENAVLGVGPGRYGGAAAKIIPSPVYDEYNTTIGRLRTVHNFWLHLAGEGGVIGVTVFLAILVSLVARLARGARAAHGQSFVVLAGAATAAVIGSVNSGTEMVLEGNIPAVLVWLILGIGAAMVPGWHGAVARRESPDLAQDPEPYTPSDRGGSSSQEHP